MKAHERLIGMDHRDLLDLAPEATHQHRKGGLYRDLGIAQDAETKQPYQDPRGPLRAWLHVHPHERSLILRPATEDDKFTPLAKSDDDDRSRTSAEEEKDDEQQHRRRRFRGTSRRGRSRGDRQIRRER